MTDIALAWNDTLFAGDFTLAGADLATDDGLKTAILISLFTDARARDDDTLPEPGTDRRGWWGDVLPPVEGDQIGSRLWLLRREKQTASVLRRARDYCEEALAWLLADQIAAAVRVETSWAGTGVLAIGVEIDRPAGPARQRFDFLFNFLLGAS